jgi:hypothetical protein
VAPGAIAKAGGAQNYVNVFTGKGSPAATAGVLQAMVDYSTPFIKKYLKSSYPYSFVAQQMDDPSLSWEEALQNISDEFLGLDCNGFVGNWILLCDKTLKLTEQSNPPVVKNATKKRRMKFEDIEEWDVVIWDNMSHIAVINQRNLDPATGKVTMIQSAGEGPISHEYIFTQGTVGSGLFNKTGGGPPEKEVGGPVRYTRSGDHRPHSWPGPVSTEPRSRRLASPGPARLEERFRRAPAARCPGRYALRAV